MRYGHQHRGLLQFALAATIGVVGVLVTGSSALAAPGAVGGDIQGADAYGAIDGQYIVVFKDATASPATVTATAHAMTGKVGGTVRRSFGSTVRGFSAGLTRNAARRLATSPEVAYVEQDRRITMAATQWNPSWGLDRIDQRHLPLSGSYTSGTASKVTAYILDTGVRLTHSQFGGRARSGFDFIDNDNDASDCQGHGTHVAGTVAGAVSGVAKDARVVSVRVLDCNGSGSYSQIIAGVDWVTRNAVKPAIANMSLGGSAGATLDAAVTKSIASGVTYVVAAGNDNTDACTKSPARVAAAITVGATANSDARAGFSNYGTCLDVFAPGANIASASNAGNTATTTMSGTSMATPHVAGAGALYLSGNPTATPAQVRDALVTTATPGKVIAAGAGSPNTLLYTAGLITAPSSPTAAPAPPSTTTDCRSITNGYDRALPDRAFVDSRIAVRGCVATASATSTVAVRVKHTDRGDIAISLIAPDGTSYPLKKATPGDNVGNLSAVYTVNASAEVRNGTWRLRIRDAYRGDRGTLDTWTLTL